MQRLRALAKPSPRSRKMFLTPAPKLLSPTASSRKVKQSYSAPLPTRSTARYHHSCNRMKKPAQLFSLKTKAKVVRFSETVVAAVSAAHSPEKLRDRNLHSVKPPSLHENRYYYCPGCSWIDLRCLRFQRIPACGKFSSWNSRAVSGRALQGVLGVALSLLLRSSIAQSAAMVSRSLMMWVALTLPNVAGVRVGSSRSRTCFEEVAAAPPESNCLIASIVAKRCAVVSFIASRFL